MPPARPSVARRPGGSSTAHESRSEKKAIHSVKGESRKDSLHTPIDVSLISSGPEKKIVDPSKFVRREGAENKLVSRESLISRSPSQTRKEFYLDRKTNPEKIILRPKRLEKKTTKKTANKKRPKTSKQLFQSFLTFFKVSSSILMPIAKMIHRLRGGGPPVPLGMIFSGFLFVNGRVKGPKEQNKQIELLLKDKNFAEEMAAWMDGAYYRGQGKTPPPFDSKPVEKEVHESVAMNLAGFYAVESGVGYLAETTGKTPMEILKEIKEGKLPEDQMLMIARFANATWKAGQPFRSLDRIQRNTFRPATLLESHELKKDFDQIQAASELLFKKLSEAEVKLEDRAGQLEALDTLLKSKDFAVEMATWLDGAYYRGQGQTPPPFDTSAVNKQVHENVAMNLAAFYAVESGIGAIIEIRQTKAEKEGKTDESTPLGVLMEIKNGKLSNDEMLLLARFANATWKAGQPFRSLDRIQRDTFRPAVKLTAEELAKDFDQIRGVAQKLVETLSKDTYELERVPLNEAHIPSFEYGQLKEVKKLDGDQYVEVQFVVSDIVEGKVVERNVTRLITMEEAKDLQILDHPNGQYGDFFNLGPLK